MRFTHSQTANDRHDLGRTGNLDAVTCEGVRVADLPTWRSFMRTLFAHPLGISIQRWSQYLAYFGWQSTSLRPVPVVKLAIRQIAARPSFASRRQVRSPRNR